MKTIFYAIIIALIAGALAVYGYLGAIPAPQAAGEKPPRIEMADPVFDFGLIGYGDKMNHTFRIKNSGLAVLEIMKVATSCGCTTAEVDNNALAPGEETNLNITYDSGAMSGSHAKGQQERIIYVKTNDPATPMAEARIKAYVQ